MNTFLKKTFVTLLKYSMKDILKKILQKFLYKCLKNFLEISREESNKGFPTVSQKNIVVKSLERNFGENSEKNIDEFLYANNERFTKIQHFKMLCTYPLFNSQEKKKKFGK